MAFLLRLRPRTTSFSVLTKITDHILAEVDMVMQAVENMRGVVCQVDIWHEGTSSGDGCVYHLYGVWVEICSWKYGGNYYFGCRECL